MKKLVSLMLAVLILTSVSVIAVSAADVDEYPHIDYYCFGQSNGYDICIINAVPKLMTCDEVIGEYLFASPNLNGDVFENQLALYAVIGEEKIYIKTAYEQGLIDISAVAKMVDGFNYRDAIAYSATMLGDVNWNRKLEIADVLEIQKVIAKIKTTIGSEVLYDPNKDGEISVEDVLLLQKKIAKAL